jgi:hypothetical protein
MGQRLTQTSAKFYGEPMASELQHRLVNARRAEALTALVEERLPMEFEVTGDVDAWPLVATGLLSRATSTLRHIFGAGSGGQAVDAATLGRSLYEHIVHLAWLAADPSAERVQAWRKVDLLSRLTADTDVRRAGDQVFTDDARAALEVQIAGLEGPERPFNLADLAIAADKRWAGVLPGMGAHTQVSSFRGFYAVLYRYYSSTAHPSFLALNHVVEDVTASRRRVVLEKPPEDRGPFGMATVVYALGLYVAAEALGWPDPDRVTAAFDRYPASA